MDDSAGLQLCHSQSIVLEPDCCINRCGMAEWCWMFGYVVSIAVPPHFREPVQGYKQTVFFLLFWLNLCQRAEEMQNKNNEKRNHICLAPF